MPQNLSQEEIDQMLKITKGTPAGSYVLALSADLKSAREEIARLKAGTQKGLFANQEGPVE